MKINFYKISCIECIDPKKYSIVYTFSFLHFKSHQNLSLKAPNIIYFFERKPTETNISISSKH